jgi:hypothetical protein
MNTLLSPPLAGPTPSAYTLEAGDSGKTVVARVTATAGTARQAVLTVASAVAP